MIKNGFTLAEMVVVMAITAIVGTILVLIFTNTLRGSNKAQVLAVIKQNGQSVLENMDKTIRGADDIICPTNPAPSNTIVVVKDGLYTRYRVALSTDGLSTAPAACLGIGKNGCIARDNPVKGTDTDETFKNNICFSVNPMPRDITQPVQILTDTNTQSGVKVENGASSSFSVSQSSGYKTNVAINFILSAGAGVPAAISDQIDPVSFQTTIGLR